jgi:hypothetical protein
MLFCGCCSPGWLCGALDVVNAAADLAINSLIKSLNVPNVSSLEDLFMLAFKSTGVKVSSSKSLVFCNCKAVIHF